MTARKLKRGQPSQPEKKPRLSITLEPELMHALDEHVKRNGQSKQGLVTVLLKKELNIK